MIGLVAGTVGFVADAGTGRFTGAAFTGIVDVGVVDFAAFVAIGVVVGAGELGGRGPVVGLTALKLGVAGVRDCML